MHTSLPQRAKAHLHELTKLSFMNKMAYLHTHACKVVTRIMKSERSDAEVQPLHNGQPTPELLVRQIADFGMGMVAKYSPRPYKGKVWFFHGSHMTEYRERWASLAQGGIETYLLPGEHLTMMEDPHVGQVAEKLNASLERIASAVPVRRFEIPRGKAADNVQPLSARS
jgi:hypothetical protein